MTMTGDEIGTLLGLMALADNRKPPEDEEGQTAMIAFWLEMIGDLTYADAALAVAQHYRETRDWIMPADIRQRVRAIRAARFAAAPPVEFDREVSADTDRFLDARRAVDRAIGDGEPWRLGAIPGVRLAAIVPAIRSGK